MRWGWGCQHLLLGYLLVRGSADVAVLVLAQPLVEVLVLDQVVRHGQVPLLAAQAVAPACLLLGQEERAGLLLLAAALRLVLCCSWHHQATHLARHPTAAHL